MDEVKNSEMNNLEADYKGKMKKILDITAEFQTMIFDLEDEVNSSKEQISSINGKLELANTSLQETNLELEALKSGTKYNLHDPSYNEVSSFMSSDTTNEIPFDSDTFDCENYVLEVNNNAEAQGIRCAMVVMYFDGIDVGHAIVGFNTVDRGMIYVEPQTDDWVENFEIGNDYWTDCVVPGNYVYSEKPYDTINEILIYW